MIKLSAIAQCDTVWTNVNVATLDDSHGTPYGLLNSQLVAVKNGEIAHIIDQKELSETDLTRLISGNGADIICGNGALLTPGLVDCHTHLVYSGNRAHEFEQRLNGASYAEIAQQGGGILSTVRATRNASVEQLVEESSPRLEALINEGVTRVEIKSGYGLTLNSELAMLRAAQRLADHFPVHIHRTLLAAHAVPPEFAGDSDGYIEHVCEVILPTAADEGLVHAVDVFCEKIGFSLQQTERVFEKASQLNLPIKGHVEQLSNLSGASLVSRYSGLSADHLEYLDETGIEKMATAGTIATLLPSAFYTLRETQLPPIDLLRKYSVDMAVATDLNPGSSPLASLLLAMNMACTLFRLTPEEALKGCTVNAAKALGVSEFSGVLKTGMQADMALWEINHPAELACQFGVNRLKQRILKGDITHG